MESNKLKGRTALVTGASSGIGRATAQALSARGARVLLASRSTNKLSELASTLVDAQALTMDVRSAESVAQALEGHDPDIIVCNAGLGIGVGPIQEGQPANWDLMIDTNVKGILHTVHATLPGLIARGSGDMVLLGSVAGRQVYPGGNVYNATKHAVKALYEALRLDTAGNGIRYTTVDPGMVETNFSVVRLDGDQAAADAVYAGMTPLRPEDVADAILYAVTRPAHMNVGEMVLWPTDQASTRDVRRS
ncbi:MAG: SDR family NAD(P)-dependent oxidoreductase [Planctomycetota bacterium]|nr:SDR family NAD(P)-dependent oxidoreductase [Planctomycetota bacterium]